MLCFRHFLVFLSPFFNSNIFTVSTVTKMSVGLWGPGEFVPTKGCVAVLMSSFNVCLQICFCWTASDIKVTLVPFSLIFMEISHTQLNPSWYGTSCVQLAHSGNEILFHNIHKSDKGADGELHVCFYLHMFWMIFHKIYKCTWHPCDCPKHVL